MPEMCPSFADFAALDEYGSTPLHEACVSGNVKLVECLLEFEADASVRSAYAYS